MTSRLSLHGITKRYPAVVANDGVCLEVAPGEIHAVLGENGAGKSTLMKVIYGAVRPDEGEILWNGQPVSVRNPHEARALGIAMVFQHFSLFDNLTAAENVWLGLDTSSTLAAVTQRIRAVAGEYGLDVDPLRPVHSLSVGERQRVEIVRALLTKPQLLMLDEIRALCHKCTVLRGGRVTGEVAPRTETNASLSRRMIGAEPLRLERHQPTLGDVALKVTGLRLPRLDQFGVTLEDIDLDVRAGEIVGIAGVSGNGQPELMAAISGEDTRAPAGSIALFGADIAAASPGVRRRA